MNIPSTINLKISVPADQDGFISLKCPFCGEMFKLNSDEINSQWHINTWCPKCGIRSNHLWDDDTNHKMNEMVENKLNELTNQIQDVFAKTLSGKNVSFKPGRRAKVKTVTPIVPKTANLELIYFSCCKLTGKVKPILKFSGCYCPYCGEIDDGTN